MGGLSSGPLTQVFEQSETGVEALWRAIGSGGDATLGADETQALDDALKNLALLAFEVIRGSSTLAGVHGVIEFFFETVGVGAFPGG